MIRRIRETGWILLAAMLAYAVVLPRFYVGYLSDDARDILAAHSLLSGHYLDWQFPGHPPLNFPLPGFPLVLTPFTFFFFHHPAFLRCVPYLLTLACIPLLQTLFAPWLRRRSLMALLVLFAFNPTTVVSAGRVMADACFMAAVLSAFVMFQSTCQKPSGRTVAWTGVLAGFAAIVRPEGILLLPAFALAFFFRRARRDAVWFLLLAAFPLLCLGIRNYAVTGAISSYGSIWRDSLPLLTGHYGPFLKNMRVETAALCVGVISGMEFNLLAIPGWVWAWTGLMLLVLWKGFSAFLRRSPQEAAVLTALFLYSLGFFILHAAWLAVDLHYLWHLLPLALFLGVKGVDASNRGWVRKAGAGLALVLLSLYGYQYVGSFNETKHKPALCQFPRETLQWISQATPRDSFFLTPNAPFAALYTQRFTMAYIEAHNEDEFRYRLLQKGVTHVLVRPASFLYVQMAEGRNPTEIWAEIPSWIASHPAHFPLLYKNPAEDSSVYAVRSSPEFVSAFALYAQAREALDQGRLAAGMEFLKASLKHAPLPSALNAYAVVCLLNGDHLLEARKALEEALHQSPQFAMAALNLARVCVRMHLLEGARRHFDDARAMSLADPSAHYLLPMIDREEKEMG